MRARFTLGAEHGFDSPQFVAAGLPGSATRAVFEEVALRSTAPVASSISGSVLDNQGDPVPGVTLRLRDLPMTTTTAGNGTFTLAGVPVGHLYLIVDPSTTTRPGMWATLEIELFVVDGVDNPLERPIYILPLDLPHAIVVSETTGGTIELPEHPGFKLEVAPGSAVFPGGGRSGVISATLVHPDRIPMAPSAGMQPRIIATIQPAGTLFDPPARFTLPNLEGLSPGSVTEMFSFDHDLGAFVSIGTGTVSENGMTVTSDPGFGVLEAGWHCVARPTPPGTVGAADLPPNAEPLRVCRNNGDDTGGTATVRLNTNLVSWLPASLAWSVSGGGNAITLTNPGSMACLNGHAQGPHAGQGQITTGFTAFATGADTISMSAVCCQTGQTFGPASREVIVSEPEVCWLDPEAASLAGDEICTTSSPAAVAMQVNDDDDNQNGVADFRESPSTVENDLRPFVPRYEPGAQGMHRFVTWREVIPPGQGSKLRLWLRDQPGVQWAAGHWLPLSDPPPVALVEAMKPSLASGDAGIQLQYVESEDDLPPANGALNPFCGKTSTFTIYRIDLDIDSDNDNPMFGVPSRTDLEDEIEDTHSEALPLPGKLTSVNDDDDDKDGVTDFADGYGAFASVDDDEINTSEAFLRADLSLPPIALDPAVATLTFAYDGSPQVEPSIAADDFPIFYFGLVESGSLRIWTREGMLARSRTPVPAGDFVPPGSYTLTDLGFSPGQTTKTIWIEPVRPSSAMADRRVSIGLDPDGPSGPLGLVAGDAVRLTALTVEITDTAAAPPAPNQIHGGGVAWISPEPDMPRLEAVIQPPLGPAMEFDCSMELDFIRPSGRIPPGGDLVQIPIAQDPPVTRGGGEPWVVWNEYPRLYEGKRFFGGDGWIECRHPLIEIKKEFRVRGRNPSWEQLRARLQGEPNAIWYMEALIRHESQSAVRPRHFLEGGEKLGTPTFGEPDGWGLMQVDYRFSAPPQYLSTRELWDWRENLSTGIRIFVDDKLCGTVKFMAWTAPRGCDGGLRFPHGQRPQAQYDSNLGNPEQCYAWSPELERWILTCGTPQLIAPDPVGGRCVFLDEPGAELVSEDALVLKRYNGVGGQSSSCTGSGRDYFEWDRPPAPSGWDRSPLRWDPVGGCFSYVERFCNALSSDLPFDPARSYRAIASRCRTIPQSPCPR